MNNQTRILRARARFHPRNLSVPLGYRRWDVNPDVILPVKEEIDELCYACSALFRGASYAQVQRYLQVKLQRKISYTAVFKLFTAYKKEREAGKTAKAREALYSKKLKMYTQAVKDYAEHFPAEEIENIPND